MVENRKEQNSYSGCCPCFKIRKKRKTDRAEMGEECPQEKRQKASEFFEDQLLPYVGDLKNLKVGQVITITGLLSKKCRRFSINLVCGSEEDTDIAFHFNPRIEQRYVVRNCRIRGHWGNEETCSLATFDFALGRAFRVEILVAERAFMVSVNGKHWCAFSYRVPVERVVGIEIRGHVDVQEVGVKQVQSYPLIPEPAVTIGLNDDSPKDACMPFIGKLSKLFSFGWSLEIGGKLKMAPQSFFVNLQDTNQIWPHPNVPLHLNPRFSTTAGIDVFVRNTWLDGCWGPEERAPIFPFLSGADFQMVIGKGEDGFTVWVDGKIVAIFSFRSEVVNINYVYISGDLAVTYVTLRDKPVFN